MYSFELFEAGKPRVVVTYPGRFQPFHQGHAGVFAQLQKKFGGDNVYIATSNDTSSAKSPFSFSDKYQLMTAAGVPGDKIIETNQMYVLPQGIDPNNTIFVTAVGSPDADRLRPDTVLKRDKRDPDGNIIKPAGSPTYYKTWGTDEKPVTADQHGYVIVIPEIKKAITIKGKTYDVSHGTETRALWNSIRKDQKARAEFLTQLYGNASAELAHIFDKIPTAVSEDISPDSPDSTSPIHGMAEDSDCAMVARRVGQLATIYMQSQNLQSLMPIDVYLKKKLTPAGEQCSNLVQRAADLSMIYAQSRNLQSLMTAEEYLNKKLQSEGLAENYEYKAPGASSQATRRVMSKMRTGSDKFVWKKPNQISGSFTDSDLISRGFKKSQFNSWGGTDEMWSKLSGISEVAMNPSAFAKSIEQGQQKGVLVGFEFEVLIPAASVAGQNRNTTTPGFDPNNNDWLNGKTAKDLILRLQPPVTNTKISSIFADLFKNKTSVIREKGLPSDVWVGYKEWADRQVSNQSNQIIPKYLLKYLKEALANSELASYRMDADRHRERPEGTAREVFLKLLTDKGVDPANLKPRSLTPEIIKKITDSADQMYYWLPGGIDQSFNNIRQLTDKVRQKFISQYYPVYGHYDRDADMNAVADNFAKFCQDTYGTTDMKQLLTTSWAFRGRVNNTTPILKEKLWYYLTPGAQVPQSLQTRSYSRGPDYRKGADFLKRNLLGSFGAIEIFTGYHQAAKKLDRWYIEPDGSLRPNDGDYSAEVVSPPLAANAAMTALKEFYQQAQEMKLYTNNSTGLHINVSIPDKLDVLKLAMFVGDQYVLQSFGRQNNSYARSVIKSLQGSSTPDLAGENLKTAEAELKQIAGRVSGDHFATVNFNGKYVSFRHAGGDYLNKMPEIINTVGRFIRAMIIAADPNAYRNEYLSKLTKMFGPKTAVPGQGVDSAELQRIIKTGVPAIKFDAALRPGYTDPNSLIAGAMNAVTGNPAGNVTAFIKPDPGVRQRLLSSSGWGAPTKEHLTNGPDNIFYTVTVVPTSPEGLMFIQRRASGLTAMPQGLFSGQGNRSGVGIMHSDNITRTNPEFNKIISALRGKTIAGPRGHLPEDAAGVGVVAKNKKMAKDPRYSMSITKDVKPSTPKNMLRAFRLSEQGINPADFEIRNTEKLDRLLVDCCEMVLQGQEENNDLYGMVAACILDPENNAVFGINTYDDASDSRKHAERVALENYKKRYGEVPQGSIIITTLSPCCHPMDERYGESCTDLINDSGVHKVYCGYKDPTQEPEQKMFHVMQTRNKKLSGICKQFADTFLDTDVVKEDIRQPDVQGSYSHQWKRMDPVKVPYSQNEIDTIKSNTEYWKQNPVKKPSNWDPKLPYSGFYDKLSDTWPVQPKSKDAQALSKATPNPARPPANPPAGTANTNDEYTGAMRQKVQQRSQFTQPHPDMERMPQIDRNRPDPVFDKNKLPFKTTSVTPDTTEVTEDTNISEENIMKLIKEFLPLAMKQLKLKKLPEIILQQHIESHDGQATFGRFVNDEEKIYLGIADRHPVDILRTLAHELTHFAQYERGEMYPGAGETGSPIENEAHVVAGIIMRHFNKKYPDAIHAQGLEIS